MTGALPAGAGGVLGPRKSRHMQERRKLGRFDLRLPAELEVLAGSEEPGTAERFALSCENISAGGVLFREGKALPERARVRVELRLQVNSPEGGKSTWSVLKVNGTVCRSDLEGTAVCFDNKYRIVPAPEKTGTPH